MKNICIVTGTRAEYGLLKPLIKSVSEADDLSLKLVVTGMHLSPEFGLTYREIEADNFEIDGRIEMVLSADTPGSILKSMGVELIGFADYLSGKQIDMMILLGDRYEIFIAASAALFYGIPIAHIHGGECTEGAVDEALRHSITKMSTLHFAATEEYRRRIIQLGEQPDNVFYVGALGIENIKNIELLSKEEVEEYIGFPVSGSIFMVTFHPVTMEIATAEAQMENLLAALDCFSNCKIIFTKANADTGGRIINELIDSYVADNEDRCVAFTSMGQKRYLSALQYCSMAIGNSSSGLIEVPSFHIPTVNIGDRQKGRISANSVIHCNTDTKSICEAIRLAFMLRNGGRLEAVSNPYEKKETSNEIMKQVRYYLNRKNNIKKHFYDLYYVKSKDK